MSTKPETAAQMLAKLRRKMDAIDSIEGVRQAFWAFANGLDPSADCVYPPDERRHAK